MEWQTFEKLCDNADLKGLPRVLWYPLSPPLPSPIFLCSIVFSRISKYVTLHGKTRNKVTAHALASMHAKTIGWSFNTLAVCHLLASLTFSII